MTAEEMFNELGYSLYYSRDKLIYGSGDYYIAFDLKDKLIEPYHDDYDTFGMEVYSYSYEFSIDELKAINKQVEELGWLDETV